MPIFAVSLEQNIPVFEQSLVALPQQIWVMVVLQQSQCGEDRELETSEGLRKPTKSSLSNGIGEALRVLQALGCSHRNS